MQLLTSNLARIISTISIIIVLASLILSRPIAAYSQFSFIVSNHQQQLPISQVVSFTKDKTKTAGVKGIELKGTGSSSKGSHHPSSITSSPLLPASTFSSGIGSNGSNDKVVIINFDDSFKSQFLY